MSSPLVPPKGTLRRDVLLLASTAGLCLAGCGPQSPEARGEDHYQRVCAACHGVDGGGIGRLGTPLAGAEILSLGDEELVAVIRKGRLPYDRHSKTGMLMPPRGGDPRLDDDDLADVVAYMRTW